MAETVVNGTVLGLELLIAPLALGFLVWAYFKITNDKNLKQPGKLTREMLESDKIPADWANPDEEELEIDDVEESKSKESSDDEGERKAPVGGQIRSQGGSCCNKGGCNNGGGSPYASMGLGPMGMQGMNNNKRPDPRTMKLLILENIKQKREDLEDEKDKMTPKEYQDKLKALDVAETRAKNMPTDPKEIEKQMEKRALSNARQMAKNTIEDIKKRRRALDQAKEEKKISMEVFHRNNLNLINSERHMEKMLDADDEELKEMMMEMQKNAEAMHKAKKAAIQKAKEETLKAKEQGKKVDEKILEVDSDNTSIITMEDEESSEELPENQVRIRKNAAKVSS